MNSVHRWKNAHTEREQIRPPHIDKNRLMMKCWTVPFVSILNSVHRRQDPHTEREKIRPQHIDRNRLMMKCLTVPFVSRFNSVHTQWIHTLKHKDQDHHILTEIAWWLSYQLFQLFLDLILFTGICIHTLKKEERYHHILIGIAWW